MKHISQVTDTLDETNKTKRSRVFRVLLTIFRYMLRFMDRVRGAILLLKEKDYKLKFIFSKI